MRNSIITANAGDKLYVKTSPVFQYDYGLTLVITGVALPEEYDVHFGNTNSAAAKEVTGNANGVSVPDEYLRNGEDVHAWLYLHTGEDDGYTVLHIHIPVIQRAAIDSEEITPIEHHLIEEALAALEEAVEDTEANVAHYPYINENGYWMRWDATQDEFVNTGIKAEGIDGQDGKDGADGKDGKDGINGQDGKDGADGKDGVNGLDGRDGVDGKDGKDGVDGKDGKDGKDADPITIHNEISNVDPLVIYDGADTVPVDEILIVIDPVQAGSGTPSPRNIRRISGFTSVAIHQIAGSTEETYEIAFGNEAGTVYGCTYNTHTGKLVVDHVLLEKRCVDMDNREIQPGWRNSGIKNIIGAGISQLYTGQILNIGTTFGVDTTDDNDLLYLGIDQYGMRQQDWINTEIVVQVCIPLATPIEYDIDPVAIEIFFGENTFSVDHGRISYIKYPCDTKLYIDHKIAELQALILDH